ncbi:MAG: peptidoglycan-binding protein, partial [Bacteroidetes bacterium]|nr:peptidoglycan-binding protein [Bacteroidota bacterium]
LFTLLILFVAALYGGPTTKFAYHTVEKGETLYSISRQYGIKPTELASYNDALGDKMTIRIGQKLKVPASAASASEEAPASMPATTTASTTTTNSEGYHIVKKGETFYSISREYKVARTDLQMWNNLDDLNVKIGQKIIVKNPKTESKEATAIASASNAEAKEAIKRQGFTYTVPTVKESNVSTATGDATASSSNVGLASTRTIKSWRAESAAVRIEDYRAKTNFDPANEYESLYYQNVYSGLTKKTETGVVKLMSDNNNTDHVVYYNNASVGTILRLTNTDNGKTTYAIVVGKVPPAENNTYLVKLSEKVARNLSIKDYTSVEVVCYSTN